MNLNNFEFVIHEDDSIILHQDGLQVQPDNFFADKHDFIDKMFDFMETSGGVGLAAPQIGLSYRFFIMNIRETRWVCVNPEIISVSETQGPFKEGCLSYPGLNLTIRRPMEIVVKYHDQYGHLQEETLSGLPARVFQHEYDHITGVVFSDLVSESKLKRAQGKIKANLKKRNRRI